MGNSCKSVAQTLARGNSKNAIRQTDEEGKKRGVSMERSKAVAKERNPEADHYLIKIQY